MEARGRYLERRQVALRHRVCFWVANQTWDRRCGLSPSNDRMKSADYLIVSPPRKYGQRRPHSLALIASRSLLEGLIDTPRDGLDTLACHLLPKSGQFLSLFAQQFELLARVPRP